MRRLTALAALVLAVLPLGARAGDAHVAAGDPRAIPLVDQDGRAFRLADLHGEPALVTFVATRCTDACPIADAQFRELSQALRQAHIRARLVTVTLDPAYDTPFVMSHEAQMLGAVSPAWVLASGSIGHVHALMRSFGVVAERGHSGIPDVHTTFVYVLDTRTRLAQTLLLSTSLVRDAEQALRGSGPR